MSRKAVMGSPLEGHTETLSNGPIPTVEIAPPVVMGEGDGMTARAVIDPQQVAPIVRDATAVGRKDDESEEKPAPVRVFQVQQTKHVLDRVSGTRVRIAEGKEISSQHYDIRDLQRQGLKLREITGVAEHEPLPN